MERIWAIIELVRLLVELFKDTDGDGKPDLIDSDPENSEVQ